jgi:hypothetical protein
VQESEPCDFRREIRMLNSSTLFKGLTISNLRDSGRNNKITPRESRDVNKFDIGIIKSEIQGTESKRYQSNISEETDQVVSPAFIGVGHYSPKTFNDLRLSYMPPRFFVLISEYLDQRIPSLIMVNRIVFKSGVVSLKENYK